MELRRSRRRLCQSQGDRRAQLPDRGHVAPFDGNALQHVLLAERQVLRARLDAEPVVRGAEHRAPASASSPKTLCLSPSIAAAASAPRAPAIRWWRSPDTAVQEGQRPPRHAARLARRRVRERLGPRRLSRVGPKSALPRMAASRRSISSSFRTTARTSASGTSAMRVKPQRSSISRKRCAGAAPPVLPIRRRAVRNAARAKTRRR